MKLFIGAIFLLFFTMLTPDISLAVTECAGKIIRVWTGDNGYVWLVFDNGVKAYTPPTDPDTKNILAVATAALLTGKTITIRFKADGVPFLAPAQLISVMILKEFG